MRFRSLPNCRGPSISQVASASPSPSSPAAPALVESRTVGPVAEDVRALLRQLIDGQRELVAEQTRQQQMLDAILQRLDRGRGARDAGDVVLVGVIVTITLVPMTRGRRRFRPGRGDRSPPAFLPMAFVESMEFSDLDVPRAADFDDREVAAEMRIAQCPVRVATFARCALEWPYFGESSGGVRLRARHGGMMPAARRVWKIVRGKFAAIWRD